MKYEFTAGMGEISGFGGGYEEVCRRLVINGTTWLDENPEANLEFKGYQGVYGIIEADSKDATSLHTAMTEGEDDVTGAMMHACTHHVLAIKEHGWDDYVSKMSKTDRGKDDTASD